MKHFLLTVVAVLAFSASARADYLLIVVNLNAKAPPPDPNQGNMTGGMGMEGGGPSPLPGGNLTGGPSPMPGGMRGGGPGPMGPMMPGMEGGTDEIDESPDLIVAVVEVKAMNRLNLLKFAKGIETQFEHRWGKVDLDPKHSMYEVIRLEKSKGVALPSAAQRFADRHKQIFADKPDTRKIITDVALYALQLGLVDECAKVMDKLAETDKSNAAVLAYLEVKKMLAQPLGKEDLASVWQKKLLSDYKITQTDTHHFALIHSAHADDVKSQLEQMEKSFKAFYYWWALRGVALPVPKDRQVAVVTEKAEDGKKLRANLTASPALVDSFQARREGLVVFSGKRTDLAFDKLDKRAQPVRDAGFVFKDLITGQPNKGLPKSFMPNLRKAQPQEQQLALAHVRNFRAVALLLKLMENEWEQTGISHEVTRHLLFASKLLPRNVNAPEWVQFGMGAFFEMPLQSPWATIGAANPYWSPRFKELHKQKKYEKSALDTMKKVVTDAYFREKPTGEKEEQITKSRESNLRKARAAAWSLTYFLARSEENLPRLQRYFKELAKQPRDVELGEKALWACFQKAFAGENMTQLANRWIAYANATTPEASDIHARVRESYAKVNAPPPPKTGGTGKGGTGKGGIGGGGPMPR